MIYYAMDDEDGETESFGSGSSVDSACKDWVSNHSAESMRLQNSFEIEVFIFDTVPPSARDDAGSERQLGQVVEKRIWEPDYSNTPKFWAGIDVEADDGVEGTTGDTADEAYEVYVSGSAHSYAEDNGCDSLEVRICKCVSPRDSGYQAEEIDPDWTFCLGDEVERRIWKRDDYDKHASATLRS